VNDSFDTARWLATQRELMLLMAHDLRNPLAAVLANLNFLELSCTPGDPDVLDAISDIKLSAESLLRMIDNLVSLSRLEAVGAARAQVPLRSLDAAAAVRAAFDRTVQSATAAGIDLALDVQDERAAFEGERSLVEQIVENLVGNVAQHVRRGRSARITLKTTATHVVLSLDDDGPVFGNENEFSRDGQLELKKRTDARYSRGLALYVIGLATHAMNGSLSVRNNDGKGHVAIAFRRAR
jgi:signal transduction histidine kinase